jgi:thioredoxin-like negative regulator of GroEL
MITGEGTSSVINFFDKESMQSKELDTLLEKMAKKFTKCKFLRIDGAWTQFISAKLGIKNFPTVLAIRDKVVLDLLTDFDEKDCFSEEFLHEWIVRSIPLINGHQS